MWQDFKKFLARGNVMDMAVGIVIGAAFTAIARSLVDDILMPPLGLLLGNVDFSELYILLRAGAEIPPPYTTLAEAREAGAIVIAYGLFINSVIAFILVAAAMFLLIRSVVRIQEQFVKEADEVKPRADTKECPYCFSTIDIKATRCSHCTSELAVSAQEVSAQAVSAQAVSAQQ
jgi:large conductance mechanosensitive channel